MRGEERNRAIVEIVSQLVKQGYKVYVDVYQVEHGKALAWMLKEKGIKAIFIHGGTPSKRRQEVLKNFEKDGFVLVSTLIKEGADLPAMSACVLAGGRKSSIQVIQTIGRALRTAPGKDHAVIVDFADQGAYVFQHYQQRIKIYRDYYGELFQPEHVYL